MMSLASPSLSVLTTETFIPARWSRGAQYFSYNFLAFPPEATGLRMTVTLYDGVETPWIVDGASQSRGGRMFPSLLRLQVSRDFPPLIVLAWRRWIISGLKMEKRCST